MRFRFGILLIIFLLINSGCEQSTRNATTQEKNDTAQISVERESSNTTKMPLLVDLGSVNCASCKKMEPILNELRTDYQGKMDVKFIDVWKDSAAGRKYNIRSIPTQIFFDGEGVELYRHVGFYSKEDILRKWKELGYEFE